THFFVFGFLKRRAIRFANFEVIRRIVGPQGNIANVHFVSSNILLLLIRVFSLTLLILASAGAQLRYRALVTSQSFVIAIDASSSMLANDVIPNRLSAAKESAFSFVNSLSQGRVGVIDFAGAAFVKQPITDDLLSVKSSIKTIEVENVGGTAIGEAIITASNMLSQEQFAKTIILITDGQNNVGAGIDEAIEHANAYNIAIYTIGIGTEQGGSFIKTELVSKLDEDSLKTIAEKTGGSYFKASTPEELKSAYQQIISARVRNTAFNLSEVFLPLGIILIFLEWTLLNTRYRTLP
ncbi:MAG: VWA domain-containing protein, partial [Candidatus Woesearchaeota archaeon]